MKSKILISLALTALALLFVSADAVAGTGLVAHLFANPEGLLVAPVAAAALPDAIKAELDKISDQLKEHAEKAAGDAKALSASAKEQVDGLLLAQGELTGRLQSAEQLLASLEQGRGNAARPQTFGEQFVSNERFSAFTEQATPRGRVDMTYQAAITTVDTDTDGAAGDTISPTRVPGIVATPNRRMTVRDLLSQGRMDGNALEFVQETGFTNAAATVGEGLAKPESTMKFDLISTTAKVIAHYVKASRQILSDNSQLASYIDGRLRYGLAYVEEQQLLNGDGTGQNLLGIIPQATAYVAPFTPAGTVTDIDELRLAMLQAALAEYPATGIVMHPTDWARIELTKDANERYLIGSPQGTTAPTLWGLPVVATQAIAADKFLVGAFKLGAQVFDRWQARVEVATENEDDFIKNLVTILAEERLALAVYRPEAFIYGDLGNVV